MTLKRKQLVAEGAAYAARSHLHRVIAAMDEGDYERAAVSMQAAVAQTIYAQERLEELRREPAYMNHPNLLHLLAAGYRQHIRGESLVEQKVLRHPWQQHSGAAYVSTDDRVTGEKHARRKERG